MKIKALFPIVLLVAGCATSDLRAPSQAVVASAAMNSASLHALVKEHDAARIAAQEVDAPYIAGDSIPLARDATMPTQLRTAQIVANFQRSPVPLDTALRQLSDASGLLITATADALLPASMFLPRGAAESMSATQESAPPAIPLMDTATYVAPPAGSVPMVVLRTGDARPLWTVLDDIAMQAGLSWRPTAGGAEFYRVETQIFHLPAIAPTMGTTASLGRSGNDSDAFETANKTSLTLRELDLVKGMADTVQALLTTGGNVVVSAESQSLIVTDTPAALARVARYLEEQHRNLSRRVRVVVDAYEITNRGNDDLGLNWGAVYETINRTVRVQSPTALAGTQAGSVGVARESGAYAGSTAVVNALSEVATVVNHRSFPFTVTSGTPYTVAIRKTFNYVDQIQLPAQVTTGQVINTFAQPPSVMQKEETVGTFLTVIPTAKADGTIYISLSIDQSSNRPLVPFTVGGGTTSGVTVQQKTIDGTGFILESPTRSGVPIVMGGIEFDTGSATERRLAAGLPLLFGGSNQSETQKTRTIIVVTAVSEEGV